MNENEQKLGDNLFKKIELLFPNKIKKCQRIVGMLLDYKDRNLIEKSLNDDKLFNELVEGAIISLQKYKKNIKIT